AGFAPRRGPGARPGAGRPAPRTHRWTTLAPRAGRGLGARDAAEHHRLTLSSRRMAAPAEAPITIVLADDHQVVRSGLRLLLETEPDFQVVAEAGDVPTTERRLGAYHPRVLILDLNMPGEPSLPAIPRLRKGAPETQIVVLTMQSDPAFAREALRAGAIGYVLKEAADSELVQADRMPAEGRTYLNPERGARLAAEPSTPNGPPDDLSGRELEVLRLIALGHTNSEIASRLYLTGRTSSRRHGVRRAPTSSPTRASTISSRVAPAGRVSARRGGPESRSAWPV